MICNTKNPVMRDGTSQTQRILNALKPGYVKVDERSLSDLLCFVRRYAETIQYYSKENAPDGDWQSFIENDISTIIALISSKDITQHKECFGDLIKTIKKASTLDDHIKGIFKALFQFVFFIADEIDTWYKRSIEGLKLQEVLNQTITSSLREPLKTIVSCYKYANDKGYLVDIIIPDRCKDIMYKGDILSSSFHPIWAIGVSSAKWETYYGAETDPGLIRIQTATDRLTPFIEGFVDAQSRIINLAPEFLQETLDRYPSHEPHIALLLAFLKLFQYAQDDLNQTTKKHLDFYYKDVLRFSNKGEVPDTVHVIFELAKQVHETYSIKKGTLVKAGKDKTGVEVFYQVDDDVVLNKAKVGQLKTVFKDTTDNGRIYAAPVAKSKDGIGGKFDTAEPKWKTFGESQWQTGSTYRKEEERTMKFAEIGFAIASPTLFLKEGVRTITITLNVSSQTNVSISSADLSVYLSGEKEWITISSQAITINNNIITIELGNDVPPIVSYNAEVLAGGFDTKFPVLNVILNNNPARNYNYAGLKGLTINSVDVKVDVDGVRDLILQNEAGLIKSNKPFYPFTTFPTVGSKFYIGSKEIFQKGLSYLKLTLNWKDVPSDNLATYYDKLNLNTTAPIPNNEAFQVAAYILSNNEWNNSIGTNSLFKSNAKETHSIEYSTSTKFFEPGLIEEDLTEYTVDTQRGFLKLELTAPPEAFGHRIYRDVYTKTVIAFAKSGLETDKNLIPNEPYTPQLNSITVDYVANEAINVQAPEAYKVDESKFFHLYPFGIKEVREESTSGPHLFPQFDNEGELYIGISGLEPRQNISMLFQMAEGSADPKLEKQVVTWAYLMNNEWIPFDKADVLSDATDGLINSGIITFDIPGEATKDNTMLAAGYHWIRASVTEKTAAICDSIDVLAQAVQVSYVNKGNDPNFLSTVLPDNTISKLKIKDAAIKGISQPYASEGGRIAEQDNQFYTRVSERLRHKRRGITIWDYEKLILEEFPSIYKVKCINHSTYIHADSESEFAPGYVSVIVIPSLRNKNMVNPLEPRAPLSTLDKIKTYLSKRISPFAALNLQVINPLYEKIKVEFQVKFKEGNDWGYYKKVLGEDIIRFLSPWAFEDGKDIVFGGKIHKSVILNFVEERDYVDFVTDFKMFHITDDKNEQQVEEAMPTTAGSILVSSPFESLKIEEVTGCV